MKPLFLTTLALLFGSLIMAQAPPSDDGEPQTMAYVAGKHISEIEAEIIAISLTTRFSENGWVVRIDYGQRRKNEEGKIVRRRFDLTNKQGEPITFFTTLQALNAIAAEGWELVGVGSQDEARDVYFFKRKGKE